jgi:serine/threonine-protein kinase
MVGSNYKLLRKIASGGMAEVFLAMQQGLAGFEKLVVVKKVHSHLCQDGRFIQMFLDEARLAASLSHPNIVQIFDIHRDEESFFIAMEYLSGEDLRYVIGTHRNRQAFIPVPLALRIAADTSAGLHAAHTATDPGGKPKGIVHRDVCPSNIIISFNGITKLVDFGLAKANVQNIYSRPGTLKGKFAYISPEQVEHKEIDARSDVFSLGVVLWEMLTSTRLFKGPNEAAVLRSVMEEMIKPPSALNPDVPRQVDDIVMSALERDYEKRVRSAGEVCDALEKVLKQIGESVSTHNVGEWMQKTFKERHQQRKELEKGANVDLAASGGLGGVGSGVSTLSGISEASPPPPAGAPAPASPAPAAEPSARKERPTPAPAPAPAAVPPAAVPTAAAPVEGAPQKEKKGGMLFVGIIVALLVVGGGGYFLFMHGDEKPSEPVAAATEPAAAEPASDEPSAEEPKATKPTPTPTATPAPDEKPETPETPPDTPPAVDDTPPASPSKKKVARAPARRPRARSFRRMRRRSRPEPKAKPEPRVAVIPQPVMPPPKPKPKPKPVVPPPPKPKPKPVAPPPKPKPKPKPVAVKAPPKPVTPAPKAKKAKKTTGKIRVLSDAPGFVFIDGRNTGKSTPALVELPAGPHTVIVVLKGTNTRITHRVKVKPGKIHRIRLRGAP